MNLLLTLEENEPHHQKHRQHKRQSEFEDITKKRRGVSLLLVGDSFHHEIRAVADVGIRAEKDRADADRLEAFHIEGSSQDDGHFDLFIRNTAIEQRFWFVRLQNGDDLANLVRIWSLGGAEVSPVRFDVCDHSRNSFRWNEGAISRAQEAQVG